MEDLYNVNKLHHELEQAEIPIYGCSSDGIINFRPEATEDKKKLAETIKAAHDPIWYVDKRKKRYAEKPIGDQLDYIYKAFKYIKSQGIDIGYDGDEWVEWINKIKESNPKNQ